MSFSDSYSPKYAIIVKLNYYLIAMQFSLTDAVIGRLRCQSVIETLALPIGKMIVKLGGSLVQMVV